MVEAQTLGWLQGPASSSSRTLFFFLAGVCWPELRILSFRVTGVGFGFRLQGEGFKVSGFGASTGI